MDGLGNGKIKDCPFQRDPKEKQEVCLAMIAMVLAEQLAGKDNPDKAMLTEGTC